MPRAWRSAPRSRRLTAGTWARSGAAELIQAAARHLRPVTILVNNAGLMTDAPVEAMLDELCEEALTVNLAAAFRACRAVIPGMLMGDLARYMSRAANGQQTQRSSRLASRARSSAGN